MPPPPAAAGPASSDFPSTQSKKPTLSARALSGSTSAHHGHAQSGNPPPATERDQNVGQYSSNVLPEMNTLRALRLQYHTQKQAQQRKVQDDRNENGAIGLGLGHKQMRPDVPVVDLVDSDSDDAATADDDFCEVVFATNNNPPTTQQNEPTQPKARFGPSAAAGPEPPSAFHAQSQWNPFQVGRYGAGFVPFSGGGGRCPVEGSRVNEPAASLSDNQFQPFVPGPDDLNELDMSLCSETEESPSASVPPRPLLTARSPPSLAHPPSESPPRPLLTARARSPPSDPRLKSAFYRRTVSTSASAARPTLSLPLERPPPSQSIVAKEREFQRWQVDRFVAKQEAYGNRKPGHQTPRQTQQQDHKSESPPHRELKRKRVGAGPRNNGGLGLGVRGRRLVRAFASVESRQQAADQISHTTTARTQIPNDLTLTQDGKSSSVVDKRKRNVETTARLNLDDCHEQNEANETKERRPRKVRRTQVPKVALEGSRPSSEAALGDDHNLIESGSKANAEAEHADASASARVRGLMQDEGRAAWQGLPDDPVLVEIKQEPTSHFDTVTGGRRALGYYDYETVKKRLVKPATRRSDRLKEKPRKNYQNPVYDLEEEDNMPELFGPRLDSGEFGCFYCLKTDRLKCKHRNQLTFVGNNPNGELVGDENYAIGSVPECLELAKSRLVEHEPVRNKGIFARRTIKKYTVFGPYEGVGCEDPDHCTCRYNCFVWNVVRDDNPGKLLCHIDGSDMRYSNYLRFINHAAKESANLVMVQRSSDIYYVADRDIEAQQELLVDYGGDFHQRLKRNKMLRDVNKFKQGTYVPPQTQQLRSPLITTIDLIDLID